MAENRYPCPECGAILKPAKPVAAGKKLRCPKCDTVFAPGAEAEAKPAAAAAKAVKRPQIEEDDGAGTYGVHEGDKEEEATREERKKALGPIKDKDRGKRSARGPAQAIATKPSNQMLATSTIFCVSCAITILVVLWPVLFSPPEPKVDEDPMYAKYTAAEKQKLLEKYSPEQKKERAIFGAIWVVLAVLAFAYNGFIAAGAVKMQSLESYPMAMIAVILIMLPFEWALAWPAFYWFIKLCISIAGEAYEMLFHLLTIGTVSGWCIYVGIWNLNTLRKEEVKAGFVEERPTD
jgi:DNA-directed RNA polymerase subunit M/transcription elongation factor TFIIS